MGKYFYVDLEYLNKNWEIGCDFLELVMWNDYGNDYWSLLKMFFLVFWFWGFSICLMILLVYELGGFRLNYIYLWFVNCLVWFWIKFKIFREKSVVVFFLGSLRYRNILIKWEFRFYKNNFIKFIMNFYKGYIFKDI